MLRIEIRHFFMPSTIKELVEATLLHMPEGKEKGILRDVLMWLGEHRYIKSEELPQPSPVFQVLRGSSMGLAHNGNLADLALANLADSWALCSEARKKFDIKGF